jgi:hypothetical protein
MRARLRHLSGGLGRGHAELGQEAAVVGLHPLLGQPPVVVVVPEDTDHLPLEVLTGGLDWTDGRVGKDPGEVTEERGARRQEAGVRDADPFTLDSLSERLATRPPHESALEALRDWMAATMTAAETAGTELDGRFWELRALRARIITTEPELRGRARASYYPFERVLAEAIGRDLGQSANSLISRLAALSAVAGLRELYESDEAQTLAAPPSAAELLRLVDTVIRFVQAGLEGGERPPP